MSPRPGLLVVWLVLGIALAACGGRSVAVPQPFPRPDRAVAGAPELVADAALPQAVVRLALEQVGRPYRDGGIDPRGFDCSGLVHYVYGTYGIDVSRRVVDLAKLGSPLGSAEIQAGDLVFFTTIAPGPSHVGIALGGGAFVHAPSRRGKVRVERLDGTYWRRRFVGARRLLAVAAE